MTPEQKRDFTSGFNRGKNPAAPDVLGAVGDAAVGGIEFIVENISMPIYNMIDKLLSSGQKPSQDDIKAQVAKAFENEDFKKRLYQGGGNGAEGLKTGGPLIGGKN